MNYDLERIYPTLLNILSIQNGYFGRVPTMGQRPEPYSYIGFKLSESFKSSLQQMSEKQLKSLTSIMTFFEIHMHPLKNLLIASDNEHLLHQFSAMTAWSHFSTIVMFGMLEIAVKNECMAELNQHGGVKYKGKEIYEFLEHNLSSEMKKGVTDRYANKGTRLEKRSESFKAIVDHLWEEIRSGFVHEGSIHSIGLEYTELNNATGSLHDPTEITSNVPMQEWLQLTWQAILNSFGYKGQLLHPNIK